MRASLKFTVWTTLLFCCFVDISQAQCDGPSCNGSVSVSMTTTTITAQNCSLSVPGQDSHNSTVTNLLPGGVHTVFAHCLNCCLEATTKPESVVDLTILSTTTSLSLEWTKPDGNVSGYKVNWTGGGQGDNLNVQQASAYIPQLTPGVQYSVAVAAVAGDGQTEGMEVTGSQYTGPAKPVNITAEHRGTNNLTISWTLPEGNADHYVVQLDHNKTQTQTSPLTFTGLYPGRLHTVNVTAVAGDLSNTSESSTFATYPLPPKSIDVNKRTNSSLDLSWDIDPEMMGAININYSVTYEEGKTNLMSRNNNVTLLSLDSGTQYEIKVTTVGPEHLHSKGVNVSACTNPNPVLDLRAYPESNTSIKVEWFYPLDDKKSYSYIILTSNTSGNVADNQSVQLNHTTVTGLEPGTRYNITVTTIFTSECMSTEEEASSYTKPNPVSNLQVPFVNSTTITLSWLSSTEYEPASSFLVQATLGPNVVHKESTASHIHSFTGLTPGEVYDFAVATVVAGVHSDYKTISAIMRPSVVTITEVTGDTTHLTVRWSEAEGKVDTYSVHLFNDTHTVEIKTDISNNTFTTEFTGLVPGVQYCAEVVTKIGDLEVNSSRACNATRPSAVTFTDITVSTNHLTVRWSEAQGKVDTYTLRLFNDGHQVVREKHFSNNTHATNFTNLTPGMLYCAEVITKSGELMNKSPKSCNSTWPSGVTITEVTGGTIHLTVRWSEAEGKVDAYTVRLFNDTHEVEIKEDLSNNTLTTEFTDLKPGVQYCAEVVTKSGLLENNSSLVCNSTFPNPPRNLSVTSQTERSLTFTWDVPEDMEPDQYSFSVTTYTGTNETQKSSFTLHMLESGSPYNITVVTVGINDFRSQAVTKRAYTRPYPVTKLQQMEITPDSVTLVWNQTEHKYDYTYLVSTSNKNSAIVTNFTYKVEELMSGTNYSFTVTTRAADGTAATPETVSYFTRPYGIKALVAYTINSTSINLTWEQPAEYKEEYTYLVETFGCRDPENRTIRTESVTISSLNAGTNCSFCVIVRAANGIEGESTCTFQYTKPQKAQPRVSSQGSNSSLLVSWSRPEGNVEFYTVYLNGTESNLTSVKLNSSGRFHTFEDLPAGRLYTAVVETQSGPFSVPSEPISNATFPNPPGSISILSKTTDSIHISWEEAPLMSGAQFKYRLEIRNSSESVNFTHLTNYTFKPLRSGTSYNVSVTTVAAKEFESQSVWYNMVTTKPFSVKALQADPSEENVTVSWSEPDEYKSTYKFAVTLLSSSGNILHNATTAMLEHAFNKLDPGTSYNFTVTTETSDGTEGSPEKTSNCTDASAVEFLECSAPNKPNATITWSWKKPKGRFSMFTVKFEDSQDEVLKGCCEFEKSDLKHFTHYTVGVTTQSCGKPSLTRMKTCQTGITNPTIPENFDSLVSAADVEFNRFTVEIDPNLLDSTKGPITYVGVLITKNENVVETTKMAQYLENTWKNADVYLTTVINITNSDENGKTHSPAGPLTVQVGDGTTWNGYPNGYLEPTQKYKFAIVLFTDLKLKNGLINSKESLFSGTDFVHQVETPQNPFVIQLGVGVSLGIFVVLLIVLIGIIIYWRRLSRKQLPDTQMSSMRSAPVKVEDYELYYKKQKADSNCGFAAEYEELKVVGTCQPKMNAQNPEVKSKNRYNNVLPYDSSRVKLSIIYGNPIDDYINANYIPGYNSRKEFIAAQGPLPSTVNDFWRMIWEKNVHTIVMLTRCNEQGRVKCEQYWTPGTKHFGNITVTTTSEIPLDDWTIRDFDIKNVKTAETRSVRHFHFTAWPDHGVPETTELLISFRHLVREHMDQYKHSPTVVHCSAGVGRTGTFIAIDRLIFQIERENVVDVYGIVHDMRMHRGLMVQTEDQYVFLNQCALDIIRSRTGTNVDLIYQNTTALSIYENIELQKR